MAGDTPQRIYDIETVEMIHMKKINKLIDQSDATSLSINQNTAELETIYDDLKNHFIFLLILSLIKPVIAEKLYLSCHFES